MSITGVTNFFALASGHQPATMIDNSFATVQAYVDSSVVTYVGGVRKFAFSAIPMAKEANK